MSSHALQVTNNESIKVIKLITHGSLWVGLLLTSLIISYDLFIFKAFQARSIAAIVIIVYLIACLVLAIQAKLRTVSWMLTSLYAAVAFWTMLYWGINTPIGIFLTSFVIILAGILLGARTIFPITLSIIVLLFGIQTVHLLNFITPDLSSAHKQATYLDVITYTTILGIFSLITWLSNNQLEKSLKRAQLAEATVRTQKESLTIELEKESARLREVQLKELQQLYRFATIGQTAAATLHELSNHLSVLNMDIDDLKQQHRNSRAIANAKEGIEQINMMVRQIRRKLNSYDDSKNFKVGPVIRRVIKDLSETSKNKSVDLTFFMNKLGTTQISGDPLALIQILTVLITNALEACAELVRAKVTIRLNIVGTFLTISVVDNGIGINEQMRETLFAPTRSSKPTGMGIGLYIAHHLAVSHFQGSIRLENAPEANTTGAHFIVQLPINS